MSHTPIRIKIAEPIGPSVENVLVFFSLSRTWSVKNKKNLLPPGVTVLHHYTLPSVGLVNETLTGVGVFFLSLSSPFPSESWEVGGQSGWVGR
jgi:amino acid transporter